MTNDQGPLVTKRVHTLRVRILLTVLMMLLLLAAGLRVDWKPVLSSMALVQPAWLAGGLCFSILGVTLRGLRLALVSGSAERYGHGWRAFSLGYAGNLVLPLGSGELVKIATFRQLTKLSLTNAASAILMDRILDVVGMLAILWVFLSLGAAPVLRTGPLLSLFSAVAFLVAGIALLAWRGHRFRLWFERRDPNRAHPRIQTWLRRFDHLHDQSQLLRTPRRLFPLLALQIFVVVVDALATWLSLKAFPFGGGVGLMAAFRLNLFVIAATALPLLPGGLGAHQVACVLAMRTYGWSQAQSLALSLIGQGVAILWVVLQGLVALLTAPRGILHFRAENTEYSGQ